ncbi:PRC-barrel domain-containing protein [Streptomyces sp. H39-S7]|uniref:PRC-barrel domain-containing protein n=1 Tax=Streptomyces sp. H39-S7 TaxID=3004357 RepID=UPI0022AF8E15|nr:PRC-barrel domain-containing protein [Streptomyces sp. H39-S7]MCZ4120971.1 PRC-barrel domain-containing protein [Streptomyces sp. H39-S7]
MAADGVFRDSNELKGLTVYDAGGEKIGHVQEVYVDDRTGRPDWVTLKTGMFGAKESFVPLAGARSDGDALHIAHDKATVKDAPRLDAGQHLDVAQEQELFAHYGLSDGTGVSGAPGVGGNRPTAPLSGREQDAAMVRSEEQQHVGTEEHEPGRARLRKFVVAAEGETEVTPQAEQPVVRKETVGDNDDQGKPGRHR